MRLPCFPTLLLAALVIGETAQAEILRKPFVEAKDGVEIRSNDAAILARLVVESGKSAWFIRLSKSWFLAPPARFCEVYLRPEVRSGRLRRGEFRCGTSFRASHEKTRWELDERLHDFAQVSLLEQPLDAAKKLPGPLEGPFAVTGKISDQDLVQAVDFVRAKNPPEDPPTPTVPHVETNADGSVEEIIGPTNRSFHASIDHKLPISRLEAKDADHVQISTSTGKGSGQQIDLQRENTRWKIVQVWQWNA